MAHTVTTPGSRASSSSSFRSDRREGEIGARGGASVCGEGVSEGLDASALRLMRASLSGQHHPFFSAIPTAAPRSLSNANSGSGSSSSGRGGVRGTATELSVECPKGLMSSECLQNMLHTARAHRSMQTQVKREAERADDRMRDMMLSEARRSANGSFEPVGASSIRKNWQSVSSLSARLTATVTGAVGTSSPCPTGL